MTPKQWAIVLVVIGAAITFAFNIFGIWWAGYLIGAAIALWLRPSLAGISVALGWAVGFLMSIFNANLLAAARIVAELAGLPGSLGVILVIVSILLAFFEGWLPALLMKRAWPNRFSR